MAEIFKKDFKSSMCNMTGVIFIAYVLMWFGIYTVAVNFGNLSAQFEYTVVNASFVSLLALPIITMRSFSEEKSARTDRLLYSLPISATSIVVGKFLATAAIFAIPVAVTAFYPLILSIYGTVYLNTCISTVVAYFFLGCLIISIGMFISSLTESQALSAILGIGAVILIYFMSSIGDLVSSGASTSLAILLALCAALGAVTYRLVGNAVAGISLGGVLAVVCAVVYAAKKSLFASLVPNVLKFLDPFQKLYGFATGIFDVGAIVYYISAAVFFLFLTVQSVEKKRWN